MIAALWRCLALRFRSTAGLTAERDRLRVAIAEGTDLRTRVAHMAEAGPVARELHRRERAGSRPERPPTR